MDKSTIHVVTEVEEYLCVLCRAFVLHEWDDMNGWTPIEHYAPCYKPCIGGGVSGSQYALANLHRFTCEACGES